MRQAADKIVSGTHSVFKDLFALTSDPFLSTVYVQYNLPDPRFDSQPNLAVLPKLFVVPIENLLYMLSGPLSDQSKELILNLTAEVCCDKLESMIKQVSPRTLKIGQMQLLSNREPLLLPLSSNACACASRQHLATRAL